MIRFSVSQKTLPFPGFDLAQSDFLLLSSECYRVAITSQSNKAWDLSPVVCEGPVSAILIILSFLKNNMYFTGFEPGSMRSFFWLSRLLPWRRTIVFSTTLISFPL